MSDQRPRNPFRDLPLPAFFFVVAGLWVTLQLIFKFGRVDLITIVSTVVGGLLFSAVLTAIVAAHRRRLGGARQATAFQTALRTGTPPADADTSRWSAELDRLDRTRIRRALVPIVASLLPLGLGVWALTDSDARSLAIVLLLVFAALDVVALVSVAVERRRVRRLRGHLDGSGSPGRADA